MPSYDYPLEFRQDVVAEADAAEQRPASWIYAFVIVMFGLQIALLLPGLGPMRTVIRASGFLFSLLMLLMLRGAGVRHPSRGFAFVAIAWLGLCLFNPDTNSMLAGVACITLYVATLSPLFWVSRVHISLKTLQGIVLIFWAFHTLSSLFGVLQIHYPGRFMPVITDTLAQQRSRFGEHVLSIKLASGEMVTRPMGLTDLAGGAAISGMYATLLGVGLLVQTKSRILKYIVRAGIVLGLFCLYISQVRALFVMTMICLVAFLVAYARPRNMKQVTTIAIYIALLTVGSFIWAVSVGGDAVTGRLGTLVNASPVEVYNSGRGIFLRQLFEEIIPSYPYGAGLGRWGMIYNYFGDKSQQDVYSEIQWTSWVIDGGLPLALVYAGAICAAILAAWRIAKGTVSDQMGGWGALLFAYGLAAMAMTLDYPFFGAQLGLEYWLLNAVLFAAYQHTLRTETPELRPLAAAYE